MSKNRVSESFMKAMMQVRGLAPTEEPVSIVESQDEVVEEEQIDEVSNKTLTSYIKKAGRQAAQADDSAENLEDLSKRLQDGGSRKMASNNAAAFRGRADKRVAGIIKAANKMTKEESEYEYMFVDNTGAIVEALDINFDSVELMFAEGVETILTEDILVEDFDELMEVSKDTLKSYQSKAQASIDATKKKGKPSKAVVAIRAKRGMGMERAKEKLHAIYKKESDARYAEATKYHQDVDKHFDDNHHDVLVKHGFKLTATGKHAGKDIKTYTHAHDNGHVTVVSVHRKDDPEHADAFGYRHEVKAVNSKGSSWTSHVPNKGGMYNQKHVDDAKNEMMPKFENHLIDVKKSGAGETNW